MPSRKAEVVPEKQWVPAKTLEEFERMFEDWWRQPFPSFFRPFSSLFRSLKGEVFRREPSMDVYEEKNDVIVKAEIFRLSKEDLRVSLTGTTVTLSREKKS